MSALEEVEFTDRYGPEGAPSMLVACRECDAMGVRIVSTDTPDPGLVALWEAAALEGKLDEFNLLWVTCPACGGTRRVHGLRKRLANAGHWAERKWDFARHCLFIRPYTARTKREVLYDRLDVVHPWLWNRWLVLRVLTGTDPARRAQRRYRRQAKKG